MRRKVEEEQPRSASDLQRTLRFERENALNCIIYPLAHLSDRNLLARVTAIPTADVEGRVGQSRGLIGDFVVMDHLPLRQLIFFEFPRQWSIFGFAVERGDQRFGYFRALADVGNQTF